MQDKDRVATLRGEWQPIETAPKDGTKILTYGKGHGNRIGSYDTNERSFAMFAIAHWAWHDSERDVPVGDGLFRKEPCRVLEGWRTEWAYFPTHWQPLPPPPISASESERPSKDSPHG
jgi:hypothetical protein